MDESNSNQTNQIVISYSPKRFQPDSVQQLLKQTSWASQRSLDTIKLSLENSICFGAFLNNEQVAFARVVSDRCTFAYLCDVVVDEKFRGQGISKQLMNQIMSHPELKQFRLFLLATTNAHGLYAKYGFVSSPENRFMYILQEGI